MKARRALALAAGSLVVLSGCGSSDSSATVSEQESPSPSTATATAESAGGVQVVDVALEEGESVAVAGYTDQGESGASVPMDVAYVRLDCQQIFKAVDTNEFDEPLDMSAEPGEQLCLVELDVTNAGEQDGWFAADLTGVLVTTDGAEHPPADVGYDPALIAEQEGSTYSADLAGIEPGAKARDYVIFAIPQSATPESLRFVTG